MNNNINFLKDKANKLTELSGVYLMKDNNGKIIYVGKAKNLKKRVTSYFRNNSNHDEKVRKMVSRIKDFDYIITDNEFEALVLECNLIKQHNPKYNILLKDSKGYHYIKISNEMYPRISVVKKVLNDNGTYLGPYINSYSVKEAVDEVNKLFNLPTCNRKFPEDFNKQRPCLNYYIKQCSGLCNNKISEQDYNDSIRQAITYLKNGSVYSIEGLKKQMVEYSEKLEYEKAAKIRDRINAIKKVSQKQKVVSNRIKEQDVIGFAKLGDICCVSILKFRNFDLIDKDDINLSDLSSLNKIRRDFIIQYYSQNEIPELITIDGELEEQQLIEEYLNKLANIKMTIKTPKKGEQNEIVKLAIKNASEQLTQIINRKGGKEIVVLEELKKLLGLSYKPTYIEAYDISNINDTGMVGGMVVFKDGKPLKSGYRRFSIKTVFKQDDYSCMKEVLSRRLKRYVEEKSKEEGFGKLPDLILVDGGKGHVSSVLEIVRKFELDIPVYGMVKDENHRTRGIVKDDGEIDIKYNSNVYNLISRIQDEVHRFSLLYQQKIHKKNSFSLELTKIKGIGEKKALSLISYFKTIENLKKASLEEISKIAKVSNDKAKEIYYFIKNI